MELYALMFTIYELDINDKKREKSRINFKEGEFESKFKI